LLFDVQVSDLKLKIEQAHADLKADRQKLIHAGKILKDDSIVSELGIKESDFLVCMATKEVSKVIIILFYIYTTTIYSSN
jgi:hypothetical protein